jgi:hypothetical protein
MSITGNQQIFYSSITNTESVNGSAVDFSQLGLSNGQVIGYFTPNLTTSITTSGLSEGANLYYTDTRVRAAITINGTTNQISASTINGTTTLSTPQNINLSATPTFAGLTLTGLTGVLRSTAGVIQGNATTDDLPEGKTNLYYTNTRAQNAITATAPVSINTGVISLGYTSNLKITSSLLDTIQNIQTTSAPQFARLLNSSINTNNMLLGTSAGSALTTGTDNILIGSTTATNLTTGTYNICIGDLAGQGSFPIISGLRNIYLGAGAYPSAASSTREIVIGGIAGNGSNTCTIAALNGLYVSNLGTGILRATSGMINLAATADFVASLTGTANRITVSASTGAITLSTPQDIGTSSSPTFARLLNSSIGSTNLLLGTNTGTNLTTGGGNTFIGQGSGSCVTSGTFNIGIGTSTFGGSGNMNSPYAQNIAIGANALFSCSTSASQNIALGSNALISLTTGNNNIQLGNGATNTLTTGSNNVYIGQAIIPSNTSVSNEGILNLTNSSITGKGNNTMFINASSGLYSYLPAFWWGYAGNQTGGIVGWIKFGSRNMELKTSDNTQLIFPYIGWWEVNVSGGVYIGNVNQNFNLYLNGSVYINNANYFNTAVGWTSASSSVLIQVVSVNSYFQIAIAGSMQTNASVPLILTAKFISL